MQNTERVARCWRRSPTSSPHAGWAAGGTNIVSGDVGGGFGPLVTIALVGVFGFDSRDLAAGVPPLVVAVILFGGVRPETGHVFPRVDA